MNAAVQEPNLADVEAWSYLELANGNVDPNVICSWCGRFTVVRYPDGILSAFRRYPREQRRMAEVIGTAKDIASAVDHCVRYAEQEART